jgi:hypothetical protein
VRTENENGGDIMVTMSGQEQYFEVTLFNTDYNTTKTDFEALMTKSY